MKTIQTNRTHSFEQWRINNISKYSDFIWPQINYTTMNSNINIITVIFEEKYHINKNLNNFINNYIDSKFKWKIINLIDSSSNNYIQIPLLKSVLGLNLSNECKEQVTSYWDYRLKTRPTNCITADIDSIEFNHNSTPIGLEAAQLYNTSNIDESLKHIYRTFAFRKNRVNPFQYIVQQKFMNNINGEAFILFHEIKDKILIDNKKVLILKNNTIFTNMLTEIYKQQLNENMFLDKYAPLLKNNIKCFDNIYDGYDFIKS